MTQKQFVEKLIKEFPEKEAALMEHYQDYGELLGHIFFAEEINGPLIELLTKNKELEELIKYCSFIEVMWFNGDNAVKNIVEVTILERLTDDVVLWKRFGNYISFQFKEVVNNEIVPSFRMWLDVPFLSE